MESISSREEFEKQYMQNLLGYVLPEVKKYEKERKVNFILAIIGCAFIYLIAVLFIAFCVITIGRAPFGRLIILAVVGGMTTVWYTIQNKLEYKIKNKVMPVLISVFSGFKWIDDASEEYYQDVLVSNVFPFFYRINLDNIAKIEHAYNDYFYGNYRGVKMDFSQAYYKTKNWNKKFEFYGGVIRICMNKSFDGETILRPKKAYFKELIKCGLEKVTLEDNEFNKKFNVFSSDQVEARYILTTALMERLKNISFKFTGSDKIYCSFVNNNIYIALESKKPLFKLFKLNKRLDNIKHFNEFFTQIASVIDLVDYLKLNERTGL